MVAKGVRVDLVEQRLVFRTDDESGHLEYPLGCGAAGPDDGEHVRKGLPDLRIESLVLKAGPVRSDRKLTGHEYKSCTSQPLDIGAGRCRRIFRQYNCRCLVFHVPNSLSCCWRV